MGRPFIPAAPNCSLASGNLRKRSHIARNSVFQKLRSQIFLQIFQSNICNSTVVYQSNIQVILVYCPGLHQKSGRSSVSSVGFLNVRGQDGGWGGRRYPLLAVASRPKKGGLQNLSESFFFVLFSRTYLKEDILQDCEQLLAPSGIEDQGGLHCETNGPAQIVLASFVVSSLPLVQIAKIHL